MYFLIRFIVMWLRSFRKIYNVDDVYIKKTNMKILMQKNIKDNINIIENCGNKMFIDTETIGLPITKGFDNYYSPRETKYYDNSRMIEIGYILYNSKNEKIKEVSNLIKPNNFEIGNSKFHGITNEKAFKEGKNLEDVLTELNNDLLSCDTIIAHNIGFDINIILAEAYRVKNKDLIKSIKLKKKECTMKISQQLMNVYKSPKLIETYEFLFKKKIKQDHRALSDVIICADCYYKIKNIVQNII